MPRILWWWRAILIASSVLADAVAFSVGNHHSPQTAELLRHPNTNVLMSRRASILGVLTVLTGTLPAVAAVAAVEDDNCQTDCMYQCTTTTSAGQTPSAKSSKETMSVQNSCLEECPNHQQCHAPPPPEMYKREPILVKAKDIAGLYPRWQDSF